MFDILTTVPEETSIPVINELYGLLLYGKLDGKPKPREGQLDQDQTAMFLSIATKFKPEDADKYVKDLNSVFDKVTGFVELSRIEEAPKDKTIPRLELAVGSTFSSDSYEAIFWIDPTTGNGQVRNIARTFRDTLKREGIRLIHESNRGLRQLNKPYEGRTSIIKYVFYFAASRKTVDLLKETFVGDSRVLTLYIDKGTPKFTRRFVPKGKAIQERLRSSAFRLHTHEKNA